MSRWIKSRLTADFGPLQAVSPLPGIVRTSTWRLRFVHDDVVVKRCENPEYVFYSRYAERLADHIRRAKVWSFVEFLAHARMSGSPFPRDVARRLAAKLPDVVHA